jgi:hypothetical protein
VNNRQIMSDPELDNRLIAFEEVDLQLEELVAKCDELISKSCSVLSRSKRIR